MKEKDLEKCLDNLITDSLIKEAEQDNAEFEAAMRNMSDEDFLALIYDTVEMPKATASYSSDPVIYEKNIALPQRIRSRILLSNANSVEDEWDEWDAPTQSSKSIIRTPAQKGWKIWIAAIASMAAILLIVFIPAYREMDSRLCESALLVSEAYMGQSRGVEVSSMEKEEVKAILPDLEKQYSISIKNAKGIAGKSSQEQDEASYYLEKLSLRETGMELVQAYLKLNQKEKAIKTLRELAESDTDPEFTEYCRKMLEILE